MESNDSVQRRELAHQILLVLLAREDLEIPATMADYDSIVTCSVTLADELIAQTQPAQVT